MLHVFFFLNEIYRYAMTKMWVAWWDTLPCQRTVCLSMTRLPSVVKMYF